MTARRRRRSAGQAGGEAPPAPPPSAAKQWTPLFLLLAAAAALHARALAAPFFADDYLFLDQVRNRGLFQALVSRDPIGNFLRPVGRQLHFWTWSHASQESPAVFHLVNLALFLGAVALLYELARRVSGRGAAVVAAAFLAFHYASDVPILWASGSQDLLALAASLAAVLLAERGASGWAAVAFAAAILSKETAAGVPLLCVIAAHRPGESVRQSALPQAPVLAVLAAWAAWWTITLPSRGALPPVQLQLSTVAAAFAHLLQVSLGLEWRHGQPLPVLSHPGVWLLVAAGGVAAWLSAGQARRSRRVWLLGAAFAVLGTLPVIAVTSIWSAYFYLLALCGVGLALGAAVGRSQAVATAAVMVLALASANARDTDEFATGHGGWTSLSHVNRFYLDRAMTRVGRYLDELKQQRPTLPRGSTLFFGNFPSFLGWQAGDGPLARWAYRDSSVRSYFVSSFNRATASRGPYYFFVIENDSLREITDRASLLQDLWYTRLLGEEWESARDALEIALPGSPNRSFTGYWLAWANYAAGDTARAFALLQSLGMTPARGPTPELARAEMAIAATDSAGAMALLAGALPRHALDAAIHSRMSDLLLAERGRFSLGALEALVVVQLAPGNAEGWRRLAVVQLMTNAPARAEKSLARYYELGGEAARNDPVAASVAKLIARVLPGGDLAQQAIRH